MKLIRNEQELQEATDRIDELWESNEGSTEFDELEILCLLVDKYEDEHYPVTPSKPVEALKFIMQQNNLSRKDLKSVIGASGRVSEVLSGKRELTLRMIKNLHREFKIPYDSLIAS
ncbi:MAG: transcriptional regulator [Pseudomonadota bacterium]